MVKSILDTDIYKFSMSYCYFRLYPLSEGTFKFNDRNKESWKNYPEIIDEFKRAICAASSLKLTEEGRKWCIENIPYIPSNYWEWLSTFQFDPSKINCYTFFDTAKLQKKIGCTISGKFPYMSIRFF